MSIAKTVLVVGSYAPSLVHFRGPLIADIVKRGHRVIAAAPAIDEGIRLALEKLGAETAEMEISNSSLNPLGFARSLSALRRLIRAHRPDVIIAYTIKPVILAAIAGRAEKVGRVVSLITGVGYAFTGGTEIKRRISRVTGTLLYRHALARSDEIVFQNEDDAVLFRELGLVPAGKPTRLVNGSGIDLNHFTPAPLPQQPSFLMIARLLKDKGIREFGAAAKRLKSEHPEVPVALVGYLDPSPDSLTQQELDELIGRGIDYLGKLDDVRPALAEASVYVLPSYREGTPRSVLEAMAMGRAIITTDAPGCRQTVRDGETGLLVPPRDADALYRAMLRFLEEPGLAERMGPAARRLAEERFDVRSVNADLLSYAGL